jgi:hypothetical protein
MTASEIDLPAALEAVSTLPEGATEARIERVGPSK